MVIKLCHSKDNFPFYSLTFPGESRENISNFASIGRCQCPLTSYDLAVFSTVSSAPRPKILYSTNDPAFTTERLQIRRFLAVSWRSILPSPGENRHSEPYSLFSAHLQQRPLNQVQDHQARQALSEQVIADVKTISLGNKSYYKPVYGGNKAVTLRANQLQGEYRRGALKVDQELGHQPWPEDRQPLGRQGAELGDRPPEAAPLFLHHAS